MALLPSVLGKSTGLYEFSSFTFTNASATGLNGPTLTQIRSAYNATAWTQNTAYLNMTTQGFQLWTVPATGNYRIEAVGAQGGRNPQQSAVGGLGARMIGTFALTQSNVIIIAVGQMGVNGPNDWTNRPGGGGGGSFVVRSPNTRLVIAGGGGGEGHGDPQYVRVGGVINASATTNANNGSIWNTQGTRGGLGGGSGNGGGVGNDGNPMGAGGGGWAGDGQDGNTVGTTAGGGKGFANGLVGGLRNQLEAGDGGFGGGGGAAAGGIAGGGGGGFSGGGGGVYTGFGGGGGSINIGTNQSNTGGFRSGHGYVTITRV